MTEQRRLELLQYIAIQWADIHHSRNQDWKMLLVVAGVFSALFVVNREGGTTVLPTKVLQSVISATGILACAIGGYIAWAHWRIFSGKQRVIEKCEVKLGIHIKLLENPWSVQRVILLVYFIVGALLIGWVIWIWLAVMNQLIALAVSVPVSSGAVVAGWFICKGQQSRIRFLLEDNDQTKEVLALDPVYFG